MSWRIRAYLAVVAFRHLGIAYTLHRDGELFERADLFRYVFEIAAVEVWTVAYLAMGLAALGGLLWPREAGIRALIALSVGLTVSWAASFVIAEAVLGTRSLIATTLFVALSLKDLIVSGMTFSNPLESMVKREELAEDQRDEMLDYQRRHDDGARP